MDEAIRVVYEGGAGEVVEKKSRFIATVQAVDSEDEAISFIERMKKKYWDARHNCYAFVIGQKMEIQRFSDDGEPSGTAGKPILEVLLGEKIHNTVIVVTRYFGGTLLGTGGLIRAYQAAAKAGIAQSVVVERVHGVVLEMKTDYNDLGKIQYLLGQRKLPILDSKYTEAVVLEALVPLSTVDEVEKAVTEATGARALLRRGDEMDFAEHDKELLVF